MSHCSHDLKKVILSLGIALWLAALITVASVPSAFAQGPDPQPSPTPPPPPAGAQTIVQVFQQIIQFPFDNIQQALENAFKGILQRSLVPLQDAVDFALTQTVFGTIPILNGAGPSTAFQTTWTRMRDLSLVLWPVLLGVIALVTMTRSAVVLGFDVEQWWQLLMEYALVVLAAATSLYWMDALNSVSIALTREIMGLPIGITLTPTLLSNALLGSALVVLTSPVTGGLTILLSLIIGIVGFILLVALILQFTARYALMFVMVAIAPFALLLELLPPTKWLSRLWLKGFVMVLLLAPTNALLYKFTAVLLGQLGNAPLGDLGSIMGNFFAALGVMSLLITLDFAVIKTIYGGVQEVTAQALNTVKGVATMGIALAGAAAGGLVAGGAIAGGGGMATGGAAATGAGGGAGGGSTAPAGAAAGANGAFSPSAALRTPQSMETAGSILSGSSNPMLRSLGGALRGIGSAGTRRQQQGAQTAREQQRSGGSDASDGQYSTERQMRELGQMAGDLGPMNSVTRAGIANGLFDMAKDMDSAQGMSPGSSMPLIRSAWQPVATSIQAARSDGGLSLPQIAAQKGFQGADAVPNFVRNEVAMAMAHHGEPVTPEALQQEQPWSQRPLYSDYQIGAHVGRQLHTDNPTHAAAFAEMYHYLRTSPNAHASTLSYQFVKMSREMGGEAQPEAMHHFVNEVATMVDQAGIGSLPDDMTAWRRLEHRHIQKG